MIICLGQQVFLSVHLCVCVCMCMREAERALSDMTSGSKYVLFLLIFSILDLRLNAFVDDL